MLRKNKLYALLCLIMTGTVLAQQDAQYTQYMYNTVTINPAYAGQRGGLSIIGFHRSQWVGLDGAPNTQTLSLHSPLRNEKIGLGFSAISDRIGPLSDINLQAQFSYTVNLNEKDLLLSFGLNTGLQNQSSDFSKGKSKVDESIYSKDFNNWSPLLGTGLFLHSQKWYFGVSIPNFLQTERFNEVTQSSVRDRIHLTAIAGYVINASDDIKIKPTFLVRGVSGAPVILDVSLNALFHEKFTLGTAYRLNDALSVLAGFQISKNFFVGYAYDTSTTPIKDQSDGSHEIILRLEIQRLGKLLSPRFF